jgi:6-phosphogluconolactonase
MGESNIVPENSQAYRISNSSTGPGTHLVVLPDLEALSRAAAQRFSALAQAHDPFSVALSGGGTPRRLYETLAAPPFCEHIPWERVHVFWGDERCVPPDDAGSNYRMARETLLDRVPLPAGNVHRIRGELGPEAAAQDYAQQLRAFFGAQRPALDLILLGMGDDGHTASLFPGSGALHETRRPVVGVTAYYQDRPARRVTLTPPAINAARQVIFLVAGAGKAQVLRDVLDGPCQPDVLPAQIVRPAAGSLSWLVDAAAATHVARSN